MRLWRKFRVLTAKEWLWLGRALGIVVGFRVALSLVSFPRLQKYLESVAPRSRAASKAEKSPVSPAQIGLAVARSSRLVPRAACLVQALATQWLLRREGYVSKLHVGVVKGEDGALLAHAWVSYEGVIVVGGDSSERYTPILRWENAPAEKVTAEEL